MDTLLNINNVLVSIMGAGALEVGLNLIKLGRITNNRALRGLIRNNYSSSTQTTERTSLLASDIQTINNFNTQVNNRNNPVAINI